MKFNIAISTGLSTPIYRQIADQVRLAVASGKLNVGDQLPSIRALAEDLVVNPNTVARAYIELEREGIFAMRQGFGTTVAEVKSPLPRKEKLKILARTADALLADARHLNIPLEDVVDLLREREAVMQPDSFK